MVKQNRFVLLPLDGSSTSLTALEPARVLADACGSSLRILHICDSELPQTDIREHLGLSEDEVPQATIEIATGNPADVIIEYTKTSLMDSVVMATHGESEQPHGLTGPVTSRVLLESQADVVVIRPRAHMEGIERILVPMDGTPSAAEAMPTALNLAKRTGASIHMLHVPPLRVDATLLEPGTLLFEGALDEADDLQRLRDEFIERFVCCHPSYSEEIPIHLEIGAGEPTQEILRAIRRVKADMVVASWHGSLGSGHAQTLKRLVCQSDAPILVVKVQAHTRTSHLILAG